MKVVIAVDSFKECLSSLEISNIIKKSIKEIDENSEVDAVVVADGGEGTVQAVIHATKGEIVKCTVHNPIGKLIEAEYGIFMENNNPTAVIEMAAASGLPLLKEEEKNPLCTSTFGTGEMILHALNKGISKFYIGIGGSATNDCGLGMIEALGGVFLDEEGKKLNIVGESLIKIKDIDLSNIHPKLKEADFTIACDVTNPLYGENGAAFIYGKQKGADDQQILELDSGLKNAADIIEKKIGKDVRDTPGAGAAGGMGAAFLAFFNSNLKSGIEIILDLNKFDLKIENCDFVITGEGRIDSQTLNGKVISGISKRCRKAGVPLIALGGSVSTSTSDLNSIGVTYISSIQMSPISLKDALNRDKAEEMIDYNTKQLYNLVKNIKKMKMVKSDV